MTPRLRRHRTGGFILLLCGLAAGCGTTVRTDLYSEPVSSQAAFSPEAISEHLQAVGGPLDRSTGSATLLEAAGYASFVWSGAGMQPVTVGDFRVRAFGPLSVARDAQVLRFARDTLIIGQSSGLVADGRSSGGTVRTGSAWMPDPGSALRSDPAVAPVAIVTAADTSRKALESLRNRGVKVVIERVGRVRQVSERPIEGLLVLRADSGAVRRLLGTEPQPGRVLPADLMTRVVADFDPAAPIVNVLGMVAGRDPVLRNELVVVGTGFDHPGESAEGPGAGTAERVAAVIEASRTLAALSDAGNGPERTTLFALWSGSREGHSGLKSWLSNPGWPAAAIHTVLVFDAAAADLVDRRGLPVRVLPDRPVPGVPSPDRPGGLFRRGISPDQAARVADVSRRLLLEIAPDLWERDPESRVPALTDPRLSNEKIP